MKTKIRTIAAVIALTIGSIAVNGMGLSNVAGPGVNMVSNWKYIPDISLYYKLLSFSAVGSQIGNQWGTQVTWTASGETQIIGYELERQVSTNPKNWVGVAYYPGSGSNNAITRSFQENFGSLTNTLYVAYRLRIYLVNGSVQYGPVQYVIIGPGSTSVGS
ncbi:MAG TPA: hypothetical protein VMC08_11255 [Bacteroidales bacterium]|nr:hypothetical protein [Bacteroidales bacterium]